MTADDIFDVIVDLHSLAKFYTGARDFNWGGRPISTRLDEWANVIQEFLERQDTLD